MEINSREKQIKQDDRFGKAGCRFLWLYSRTKGWNFNFPTILLCDLDKLLYLGEPQYPHLSN